MAHKLSVMEKFIASQLQESAEVKMAVAESGLGIIAQMAELLI